MNITKKHYKTIMLLLATFSITSCSTYPNKFKCGDAKGLGCTMLAEVDKQIDSGQIEQAYASKKCRGKNCSANQATEMLNLKRQDKADSYLDEAVMNLDDDNNLHF